MNNGIKANRIGLCVAAFAACAASGQAAVQGPPPIVERAAQVMMAPLAGVVVQERHITIEANAGPVHFSEQNDAAVLLQDGEYKHVRYLRATQNGKTLSTNALTQRDDETNRDLDAGHLFFKQPYDPRYFHDYTYVDGGADGHERVVGFNSVVRDDQHGDGSMQIDTTSGRVTNVTYTPDVLPNHASTGTTVETFGDLAPGVWSIVSILHTYEGRVAFIKGNGKMTETLDHFRRFDAAAAGMQFLQKAEI